MQYGDIIKIDSEREFRDIEQLCFDHGYTWYLGGNPQRDYNNFKEDFDSISISTDMEMCGHNKDFSDGFFTAKEYLEKHGKNKQPEKRYRIKTEKEFIDRYGIHWRSHVSWEFPKGTDYSLGKLLSKKHNQEMIEFGETTLYKTGHTVSMDMVILDTKSRPKPTQSKISTLLGQVFEKPNITLKKSLFNNKRTHLNQTS